jgi:hypothetical protein
MPRSGACQPWINGTEVQALPSIQAAIAKASSPQKTSGITLSSEQINAICAECAAAATEVLYSLSGKVLTGECGPVTIRPLARPADVDARSWLGSGGAWGSGYTFGSVVWFGMGAGGVVSHFGTSTPPELVLPDYPVNVITQVLIDGVVIPPEEYELRDHRTLVRIRPTPSYVPTERYGWPTAQINDLPDSEMGTFSVTYTFGQDPGSMGRLACKKLAEYLALPQFGDSTHYPQRVTSFTRQGVSAMVVDVMDILKSKQLGIYEVDAWILAVNPTRATRQSAVWSPDTGRQRRQQYPSPTR